MLTRASSASSLTRETSCLRRSVDSGGTLRRITRPSLFGARPTSLDWIAPYIDPAVLALISVVIIPIPIATVRRAVADMLLLTPPDLKAHVDAVAEETVARHGFLGYRAYVARVGRARQIELYFIVPKNGPAERLEAWDRIRDEIGDAIGDESHNRWLTIAFTTDTGWAE